MKDIIVLQEKMVLLEQEVRTLTDKIGSLEASLRDLDDLKLEMKGLKLFLNRAHPEFKAQFPEIVKKLQE